jgi:hypothetical protein
MPKTSIDDINDERLWTITRDELGYLSDRLYSRGISTLTTASPTERRDLINASRVITRLLAMYERGSQRTLSAIMLGGQC